MRSRWFTQLVVLGAVVLMGSSCSKTSASPADSPSPSAPSPSATGAIDVTLSDYVIGLGSNTAKAGNVTFDVSNTSGQEHEFVVFQTDLAPESLPKNSDGVVDEEGKGVTHLDEIPGLKAGASGSLSVDLAAGNYVFVCNLPGHYTQGMHVAFTVS